MLTTSEKEIVETVSEVKTGDFTTMSILMVTRIADGHCRYRQEVSLRQENEGPPRKTTYLTGWFPAGTSYGDAVKGSVSFSSPLPREKKKEYYDGRDIEHPEWGSWWCQVLTYSDDSEVVHSGFIAPRQDRGLLFDLFAWIGRRFFKLAEAVAAEKE